MSDPVIPSNNNWFANTVGLMLVSFLCALTAYLTVKIANLQGDIPPNLAFVCGQIMGFLTAKLSTVVDWGFGGSSSQKRQGEIIAQQAVTQDKLATTAAAAQNALAPLSPDKTVSLAAGGTVPVKADDPTTPGDTAP